jgi:glyoxylase-like metal-dependent hydrolase (beta-lactamase superfamily II)
MAEVVVLRSGYARVETDGVTRAGGSVALVLSERRIIVDTGGPSERSVILGALARNGLVPEQIDCVVCTHGHTDHVGNNNLFPGATFFMGGDCSRGDRFREVDYASGPLEIAPDVQVTATPGHTSEDLSVVVRTARGVVAIVGDLFEDANDALGDRWAAFSRDPVRQRRSRAEILAIADCIVPGHGEPFFGAVFRGRRP